ncbi:MAG: DegT/DnrJ/EryC1/StrS aminotransferase family protein [Planctomycetes bacterium]|nr:DegT/DnrJ/EryC1/StrS aminotransferase family protein [Planctomycetota bacterium]
MTERLAIYGGHPIRSRFLPFGSPRLDEAEVEEVVDTLRSGWFGPGPKVARFEEELRSYVGASRACAVNSRTAALHLALLAIGVKPGDEVLTSPLAFCAAANAILHAGARPVFVDVDRRTMNLAPAKIEAAVTAKTRALVPVHLAGRPCEMDAVLAAARRLGLWVIEDAGDCLEGVYHGKKIGTLGDITCFGFYATKNLTTGDGGMLVTERDEWADRARLLARHGLSRDAWQRHSESSNRPYQVVAPGYAYAMLDIQAALGLHQIEHLREGLRRRNEVWARYDAALADLPLILPAPAGPDTVHARHQYTVLVDPNRVGISRDNFRIALAKENVGSGVHYRALHLEPYFAETYGTKAGDLPEAEYVGDRTLSLPLSPVLTDADVEDVVAAVRKVTLSFCDLTGVEAPDAAGAVGAP